MFFKAILKFYLVLVFFISEILVSFSILFKAILKFQLFFSKWTIRILVSFSSGNYK